MVDGEYSLTFVEPENKPTDRTKTAYHKISALFLPYDLARTHVEILDVRPEQLQKNLTGEEAIAEGWPRELDPFPLVNPKSKALQWFVKKWDSINAARGHPWARNDWVWRYEYKRTEKPC